MEATVAGYDAQSSANALRAAAQMYRVLRGAAATAYLDGVLERTS
jgi:hypothetical protein